MKPSTPTAYAHIDGGLLRRGFWVYVIEVTTASGRKYHYVGRTGDTSSPRASSLFARLAAHFNQKPSAKGNSLFRRVSDDLRLSCDECSYRVVGIGPLYAEESSMELHKNPRDKMAALERHLAELLTLRGYEVIGKQHPRAKPVEVTLLERVMPAINQHFPEQTGRR